jgi:hypothetical protein
MLGPLPSIVPASLIEFEMNSQTLFKLLEQFSDADKERGQFNAMVIEVHVMASIIKFLLSPMELQFLDD